MEYTSQGNGLTWSTRGWLVGNGGCDWGVWGGGSSPGVVVVMHAGSCVPEVRLGVVETLLRATFPSVASLARLRLATAVATWWPVHATRLAVSYAEQTMISHAQWFFLPMCVLSVIIYAMLTNYILVNCRPVIRYITVRMCLTILMYEYNMYEVLRYFNIGDVLR